MALPPLGNLMNRNRLQPLGLPSLSSANSAQNFAASSKLSATNQSAQSSSVDLAVSNKRNGVEVSAFSSFDAEFPTDAKSSLGFDGKEGGVGEGRISALRIAVRNSPPTIALEYRDRKYGNKRRV